MANLRSDIDREIVGTGKLSHVDDLAVGLSFQILQNTHSGSFLTSIRLFPTENEAPRACCTLTPLPTAAIRMADDGRTIGDHPGVEAAAMGIFATGVAVSIFLIASHDRPFNGEISVKPDLLLQVMPEEAAAQDAIVGHVRCPRGPELRPQNGPAYLKLTAPAELVRSQSDSPDAWAWRQAWRPGRRDQRGHLP